jgi:GDP-L-fucose synthase
MKKVIVIGGTGFIGRALVARLNTMGCQVESVGSAEADLREFDSLDKYDGDYDTVFHLAAWTQAGDFCLYNQGQQWLTNQKINTTVLDWCARCNPKAKIVAFGTSCAYAPGSQHLEDEYLKGDPIDDLYTYAMTKRMLYIGLKGLNKQFGQEYLVVVPSTVYGPNYFLHGKQLHFIFDLTRKILSCKYKNEPVVLWGDGFQRRELIFIDDFLDDLLFLVPKVKNDIVNIGAGEDYSIRDFADIICEEVGVDKMAVIYDDTAYVGARSKILNCDKLKSLVPTFHRTDLRQGIQATVKWMESELF